MSKYYYKNSSLNFVGPYDIIDIITDDNVNYDTEILYENDLNKVIKLKDIEELKNEYDKLKQNENYTKIVPYSSFTLSAFASIFLFPLGIIAFFINLYAVDLFYKGYIKAYKKYLNLSESISIWAIILGIILYIMLYLNFFYDTDIMHKY
jgi:hypothetical protein